MRKPLFVTLCGSTRFAEVFAAVNLAKTLDGEIVMSIGAAKNDDKLSLTPEQKDRLDKLHLWKIDAADYVHVINVGGYVGDSTMQEVAYAVYTKTPLQFHEVEAGQKWLDSPDTQKRLEGILGAFMLKGPPHRRKEAGEPLEASELIESLLNSIAHRNGGCGNPGCLTCGSKGKEAKKAPPQ